MYLEIVSPEATLFSANVDSVVVPGINGEFEMLENHAPIVSLLGKGTVKVRVHGQEHKSFDELPDVIVPSANDAKVLTLNIQSGTIEMKDNKVIVLAD